MAHEHTEVLSVCQEISNQRGKSNKNLGTAYISQGAKQRGNEGTKIFLSIFSSFNQEVLTHSGEQIKMVTADKSLYQCLPTTETKRSLTLVSHTCFVQELTSCLCFFICEWRGAHNV